MSLENYTLLHVLISLVGIASGGVVIYGFLTAKRLDGWNALFLLATILTSISGFGFPFKGVTPAIKLGIISLIVLAVAVLARYVFRLNGRSLGIYVVAASMAEYFNVFVLVVQSFEKIPFLRAVAPTQKEPPFLVAQLVVLAILIALTVLSVKRFHPQSHAVTKATGKAA
ncbi:MAG TPA: hypothetical protein VFA85_03055 [Terriglobales bacterium]|nr:hypothetical protein [Terriglobales bacterium]